MICCCETPEKLTFLKKQILSEKIAGDLYNTLKIKT